MQKSNTQKATSSPSRNKPASGCQLNQVKIQIKAQEKQ